MDIIASFLLWFLVDVCGMKSIIKEKSIWWKIIKFLIMIFIGFVGMAIYITIFS